MKFYDQGREAAALRGRHSAGCCSRCSRNPRFVFRAERAPAAVDATGNYRISDIELASRLSFFLWGTVPDAEADPGGDAEARSRRARACRQQVRRMLADPRADALATRFASQWLRLQDVDKIRPDGLSIRTGIARCRTRSAGDRAVLRQPRARGSQRARPAHRRLLVRQRAHRAALRHPERHRRRRSARSRCPRRGAASSARAACCC